MIILEQHAALILIAQGDKPANLAHVVCLGIDCNISLSFFMMRKYRFTTNKMSTFAAVSPATSCTGDYDCTNGKTCQGGICGTYICERITIF